MSNSPVGLEWQNSTSVDSKLPSTLDVISTNSKQRSTESGKYKLTHFQSQNTSWSIAAPHIVDSWLTLDPSRQSSSWWTNVGNYTRTVPVITRHLFTTSLKTSSYNSTYLFKNIWYHERNNITFNTKNKHNMASSVTDPVGVENLRICSARELAENWPGRYIRNVSHLLHKAINGDIHEGNLKEYNKQTDDSSPEYLFGKKFKSNI